MILCKDCNHYRVGPFSLTASLPSKCACPQNTDIDFETGNIIYLNPLRKFREERCSVEHAYYFEEKRGD